MFEEPHCKTLQQEYEIVAISMPELSLLDGKNILVTGATGLIGSQVIKTLLCFNRIFGKNIHLLANARNPEKIKRQYDHLIGRSCFHIMQADVLEPIESDFSVDYIIHCASITSSKSFVNEPVDTIRTLLQGTANVLDFAVRKHVESFLYLSSLEVYGIPPKYEVSESDYGFIDFLNVRSSYSEGKRMTECLCQAYQAQYHVPVRIARLTQIIGTGIDYQDDRVFAQFARSVIEKKDIILNTAGRTVRSYCGTMDAVTAILTVLLHGQDGEAYNVANMDTAVSVVELAKLVCEMNPEADIQIVFNTSANVATLGYNPEMRICLDTRKIQELGWQPSQGIREIFGNLITGLREKKEMAEEND